ncbi:hypothetical protein E2C01_001954 [Portunus trituberculatus]|uniref:Uncharacterized protein n=1 Tax=Portunus trituberculatus TaxID=210409 RepID=A0A5B7CLR6_PORTR|nr:hypothetical protein [Portunus trituberculatus]
MPQPPQDPKCCNNVNSLRKKGRKTEKNCSLDSISDEGLNFPKYHYKPIKALPMKKFINVKYRKLK